MEYKLQPLRVPASWTVCVNNLYEVDPHRDTMDWFMASCLFEAEKRRDGFYVEVQYVESVGYEMALYFRPAFEEPLRRMDHFVTLLEVTAVGRVELVEALETAMADPDRYRMNPRANQGH